MKERARKREGFRHQKLSVPGPVSVVCKVEVEEPERLRLVASEVPLWGEVVVAAQPNEEPVPLVVHVRFVASRASPRVWPREMTGLRTEPMNKAKGIAALRNGVFIVSRVRRVNHTP
jgi:hypothetical protein